MASNYWVSSQHLVWEGVEPLSEINGSLCGQDHSKPLPDERLVYTYIQQQINRLGKRLGIRQVVLATAIVFVRRFYAKVHFSEANLYLVLTTAFYLACKIEECPHHIKMVTNEARNLWPALAPWDTVKLGECEFWIISELGANLVVHHPYREVTELQKTLGLTQNEMTLAWYVVNDHYVTTVCLKYPPCTIAAAAVTLAVTLRSSQPSETALSSANKLGKGIAAGRKAGSATNIETKTEVLTAWLTEREDSIASLVQSIQEIVSLYALQESYSEKSCKERIDGFIREHKLLDSTSRVT